MTQAPAAIFKIPTKIPQLVPDRVAKPLVAGSPQYRRAESYFAPLTGLATGLGTELNFGLVPYRPGDQEPGTTGDQARLVDAALAASPRRQPRLGRLHRVRDGPRGQGRHPGAA